MQTFGGLRNAAHSEVSDGYISRALPLLGNLTDHGGTRKGVWPRGKTERLFFALVASPWLPPLARNLPVVEVGSNDGTDFAVPVARSRHGRLYCFEPTRSVFQTLTSNFARSGITWLNASRPGVRGTFRHARSGTVLAHNAAVSNETGVARFTEAINPVHNFANTLSGTDGLPNYIKGRSREVSVEMVTLDSVLVAETRGLLMLKLDTQGHEFHILRGAMNYLRENPVYTILLEFTPKLLLNAGVQPMQLMQLLYKTLGYQCFDLSPPPNDSAPLSLSFKKFLVHYSPEGRNFGRWTDLLCVNFALM